VRKGKITLNVRQEGFDAYRRQLDFIANRLVLSVIIGALIISAGLSYSLSIGKPVAGLLGIPYFTLMCMVLAAFLGFVAFVNDLRSGRNKH
jgi:TRAP-type C4-dicarboxylate transport system permease small subunit